MESLRFLMVTTFYPPYHLGGDAVHVKYLAEALQAQGHEVHVEFAPAAYRLKRPRVPPAPGRAEDGIALHPIPSPLGRAQPVAAYLSGSARSVSRFHARLARDVRPDIVHHHNISLLGLGVLDGPPAERTLYTAHDYWFRCPRSDLFKYGRAPCASATCVRCTLATGRPPQLWRYGTRLRGLDRIDCAIAPSRFMMGAMAGHLACPVVHIPNFAPDHNPGRTNRAPGDAYLYVGVLERHKGILALAAAAARSSSEWSLTVVGRGREERGLRRLALQGRGRLDVRGWASAADLADAYRTARALIVPSLWYENAPLVALEALSWGSPLLVARRGGLEELVDGGSAGRSFEPTPEGIDDAVRGFDGAGLPAALRQGARNAYEARHRPSSYLERYRSLWDGTAELDRAPPRSTPAMTTQAGNVT